MDNRSTLKRLRIEYGLTRKRMALVIPVPLATLNNWLAPETSKSSRGCPDYIVQLFKLKLGRRKKVNQ